MAAPQINGTRHSWASIEITLFGRIVTGITGIDYSQEQEKEDFYGQGSNPVHRGKGNKKATANLKLYKYEVDAILSAAGAGKDLTDIDKFNIAVTYLPTGADTLVTDVINNAEFTKDTRSMKSGDKMIEVDLPLICSHITYNKRG